MAKKKKYVAPSPLKTIDAENLVSENVVEALSIGTAGVIVLINGESCYVPGASLSVISGKIITVDAGDNKGNDIVEAMQIGQLGTIVIANGNPVFVPRAVIQMNGETPRINGSAQ